MYFIRCTIPEMYPVLHNSDTALKSLAEDTNLRIITADKGGGVVILNTNVYRKMSEWNSAECIHNFNVDTSTLPLRRVHRV